MHTTDKFNRFVVISPLTGVVEADGAAVIVPADGVVDDPDDSRQIFSNTKYGLSPLWRPLVLSVVNFFTTPDAKDPVMVASVSEIMTKDSS